MKCWLIQIGEPLPIRVGVRKQRMALLCEAMLKKGHHVIRWGSAFDHITKTMLSSKDDEIIISQNYSIRLIKGIGYKKNISIKRYIDHAIIEKKLLNFARNASCLPDVILIATPPHGLAYKIVKFANKRNIPVILDIRDQWPDIFVERLWKSVQGIGRLFFAYEFYKFRQAVNRADSVTATMKELLSWGLKKAGRSETTQDKVYYIGAEKAMQPDPDVLSATFKAKLPLLRGKKVFTFIGTFSNFQHPSIVVDVARKLEKENRKDIIFAIAGAGEHFERIKENSLNLKNVVLFGWLNYEEIQALLNVSHVGICPLNENKPFFPNKAFLYLSAFLPVIASTPGEFEGLIKRYDLGYFYSPGDTEALKRAILRLSGEDSFASKRKNVRRVFHDLFDADIIYDDFSKHIEGIGTHQTSYNAN